jgi:hypothetical protein
MLLKGANLLDMCGSAANWFKGFVSGANSDYCFRQVVDRLAGDTTNRYENYRGQC